jgi:hypothetical protein
MNILWASKNAHVRSVLAKAPVTGNDSFSAINDCFSLANCKISPGAAESYTVSLTCAIHLFKFMGVDGGEIQECILDVPHTHTWLPLGMLLVCPSSGTLYSLEEQNLGQRI